VDSFAAMQDSGCIVRTFECVDTWDGDADVGFAFLKFARPARQVVRGWQARVGTKIGSIPAVALDGAVHRRQGPRGPAFAGPGPNGCRPDANFYSVGSQGTCGHPGWRGETGVADWPEFAG